MSRSTRFSHSSNRIKAESPLHTGVNSKIISKNKDDLSRSNSRISSASIPATPRSEEEILQSTNLKCFSFNELKTATRNFRPDSVVGEGGFGAVFKGWIDEHSLAPARPGTGMVTAVKGLNQEGLQGHKEWLVMKDPIRLIQSMQLNASSRGENKKAPMDS